MTFSFRVPKDKFDVLAMEQALGHGCQPDNGTISDLLKWTQDENWPVAGPVSKLLSSFGAEVAPAILEVLNGTDECWKHALLSGLVTQLNPEAWERVEPSVRRLAEQPTDVEIREELNSAAQQALAQHSKKSG